jgi:hypothetical protein
LSWHLRSAGGKLLMKDAEGDSERSAKRLASMLSALFDRYADGRIC